jgi:hypothetical protein
MTRELQAATSALRKHLDAIEAERHESYTRAEFFAAMDLLREAEARRVAGEREQASSVPEAHTPECGSTCGSERGFDE